MLTIGLIMVTDDAGYFIPLLIVCILHEFEGIGKFR